MIHKSENGIEWLEFELLAPFKALKHAIFLRHGGKSVGEYQSLNLSRWMGDNPDHVAENHKSVKSIFSYNHLSEARQVHADDIFILDKSNFCKPIISDALVTATLDIALKITHADCQAAIFYDPIQNVLANVHAGWRGQCLNIYDKVVNLLKGKFHCNPADIHVAISPSLGPQHAEFVNYRVEFPEAFWDFKVSGNHFDLWELAKYQLMQAKVLKSHIQIAGLCTYESHDCFSYRRQNRKTGTHGTFAMLL